MCGAHAGHASGCASERPGRFRRCCESRGPGAHAGGLPGYDGTHGGCAGRSARVARGDAVDPPLRGAGGRDVREGRGRRLPAPRDRRGGDDHRRGAGDARRGLPDLHLPLARARARPRHRPEERHGRAVRQGDRRLGRPRRLDAHVRRRAALHGRLRDRRRQPAARGRHRALERLPRDRRGHRLRLRRRRGQPGHVRRDAEPRGAVEPAGRLHGHQQPVRDGHLARAPHGADRPAQARRGLRRARPALRRHGRGRHLRGDVGGDRAGPRRAHADPRRGRHLPLPRPLDGRPGGVPRQGAGRGVAQEATRSRPTPSGSSSPRTTSPSSTRRRSRGSTRPSTFAEESDFPSPESIYDHIYVP